MSVNTLSIRLPGLSVAIAIARPERRRHSNPHTSNPTRTTGEQLKCHAMLQARHMLTWQSLRQ